MGIVARHRYRQILHPFTIPSCGPRPLPEIPPSMESPLTTIAHGSTHTRCPALKQLHVIKFAGRARIHSRQAGSTLVYVFYHGNWMRRRNLESRTGPCLRFASHWATFQLGSRSL